MLVLAIVCAVLHAFFSYTIFGPPRPSWSLYFTLDTAISRAVTADSSGVAEEDETIDTNEKRQRFYIKRCTSGTVENIAFRQKVSKVNSLTRWWVGLPPAHDHLWIRTEIQVPAVSKFTGLLSTESITTFAQAAEAAGMVSSSLNFVNDKQAGRQLGLYWCAAKESTGFKDSNSLTNKAKHGERMILFVHGGGFTKLHPTVFEGLCYRISKATGLRIASVDYRLSPEHRFPAALYDIAASYWHLTNPNGPFRFNPQNVILAGDSAGGNLVLSFMAYIRDQLQIAECGDQVLLPQAGGAILISPYVDLNSDTQSWSLNSKYDVIGNPAKRNPMHPARMYTMPFVFTRGSSASKYRGWDDQRLYELINHEYVSPINLKTTRGLPPLLIQYGGAELLYEDIMQFIEKVHADNDKDDGRHKCTQLVAEEYADMVHDFQLFQYLDESKRAIDSMAKWIKETLGS